MDETDLINILILIKMIEVVLQYGLLLCISYIFVKSLTWQKVKKEVYEYAPVLSVVFLIAFILNSAVFYIFS